MVETFFPRIILLFLIFIKVFNIIFRLLLIEFVVVLLSNSIIYNLKDETKHAYKIKIMIKIENLQLKFGNRVPSIKLIDGHLPDFVCCAGTILRISVAFVGHPIKKDNVRKSVS